jgi:FtsP/CotA-like multicopper oxidase with cupredoxin domain
MLNRRDLIKLGLYGGTGGLLHLTRLDSGALAWALDEDGDSDDDDRKHHRHPHHPHVKPFTIKLPIPPKKKRVSFNTVLGWKPAPPILDPTATYYEVHMRQAPVQIFPGRRGTVIWGFDPINLGPTYIGPTFEANIGETVVVRMHNNLGPNIGSIIHHHGAHVTSVYDGSALWSQQIQAGRFKDFVYPNDDDIAATHWYHDHNIDFTGHNVFMGLEGLFLLHDAGELALNLPGNPHDPAPVGQLPFDLPFVIQDRTFDANLQLVYNPFASRGFLGNTFLVNGAIQPSIPVANRKYRLRILNGSNARFYHLTLRTDTGASIPFHIIGSDGGLYNAAVRVDGGFQIAPSERVEVIVDFSSLTPGPTTQVFLNNCLMQTDGRKPSGLVADCTNVPRTPGFDGVGSLCCFDVLFPASQPPFQGDHSSFTPGQTLRTDLPVYDPSIARPPVPGTKPGATRDWQFDRSQGGEWLIDCFNGNGAMPFDPGPPPPAPENPRIDATVNVGDTEIWRLINGSGGWYHPVHIHRNQFRILDRTDSGSGQSLGLLPTQLGLKDVFVLEANVSIRLITKYTNGPKATQTGKYVMHCHNVEHEDMAMMIVWEVV